MEDNNSSGGKRMTENKPYRCEKCNVEFSSDAELREHEATRHAGKPQREQVGSRMDRYGEGPEREDVPPSDPESAKREDIERESRMKRRKALVMQLAEEE
jgi:hypothetical protein